MKTNLRSIIFLSALTMAAAQSARANPVEAPAPESIEKTIAVTGRPVAVELTGAQGEAGAAGWNGDGPVCSIDGSGGVNHGGDGQWGGNGGKGGDGPNVEIVTANLNLLTSVKIISRGGPGGPGGPGGYGASGCNGGGTGFNGGSGSDGPNGDPGALYVVVGDRQVAPMVDQAIVPLQQLLSKPVLLNRNFWQARRGALHLLAANSEVQDQYFEFDHTVTAMITVSYAGAGSLNAAELASKIHLSLVGENADSISITFDDAVAKFDVQKNGNNYSVTISDFRRISELFNMKMKLIGDTRKARAFTADAQAQLIVVDNSGLDAAVKFTVQLIACWTSQPQQKTLDDVLSLNWGPSPSAKSYCMLNDAADSFSNYNANTVIDEKYIKKTPTGYVIALGRFAAVQSARMHPRKGNDGVWLGARGSVVHVSKTYDGVTQTQDFTVKN